MSKKKKSATGPNLTNVTYMGRLVVKYGAILLVLLMVGRFALTSFIGFWQAINPPPPPPPTVGFGLLPQVEFPQQLAGNKPSRYELETKTGTLPNLGDRAKVFLMPQSETSLFNDQETKKVANVFGYVFEPQILDTRTYRFIRTQPVNGVFEIDIVDKTFSLKTNTLSRPELLINSQLPDVSSAVTSVKSLLTSSGLLTDDIATVSGEVVFLKLNGDQLVPVLSLSDAQFARVDLMRTPIDGQYLVATPEGGKGTVSAVLGGNLKGPSGLVEMWYQHYPIDYSFYETYPLRSTQNAWEVMQSGEGYIAGGQSLETAVIRHISLGYFDSFESQEFFQPIYIFAGDEGFLGYVSAVDPLQVQKLQP